MNCWEFKKCGREPGGRKAEELGVCPAAVESSYDGINFGENAGRICWAVAGTCCGGKVQGTFAEKRKTCVTCDFYQKVQEQEGRSSAKQKLLRFFEEELTGTILLDMAQCKFVKAGERIVEQGEIRDRAYIIQRGSCLVVVEKDGQLHPVDHRVRGDIIGVTSILTGEPQSAHIEAETDVELWTIDGSVLDNIATEHPELLEFLTDIVASRFDTKRPLADRSIGKYIASEIIGRGSFSIVYSGVHASLNMPVTIKMMKHDLALNPEFFANFVNEAKTVAKLNHENIVQVYDIEEAFRTVFIIMERLTGTPLNELLRSAFKLPPKRVVNFISQIAQGLDYAHQHGIVHQDIKPANVIILPNDKLKILDFGLACPVGSENFLVGTPHYMSPEQVQCLPVDQRSDIYSLGLVAFEMLTGRRPFEHKDQFRAMEMRTEREIPDPIELIPDISGPLRDFILKACAREPARRYQNMTEVLAAIKHLAARYGLANGEIYPSKRKIRMFYMAYWDEDTKALKSAVEDFNLRMQQLGVEFKAGDYLEF
jgi:predicted Ser/Thr protein kinase